jgi:diguanylate cyclase (GGDEF)-like protein
MKSPGRSEDLVLLAGLVVALIVIFSHAFESLLEFFRSIEDGRGLRLLQALLIIATVFVFYQVRKRQVMTAEALDATTEARQATERAAEMERLVSFGQALARSLNQESIQAAASAYIPLLAPGRLAWALARTGTQWHALAAVGESTIAERERAARMALGEAEPAVGTGARFSCFPMIIAGDPLGVLAVAADPPLKDEQRRILTAAAALLAVSLKNAALFREVHENSVRDSLTGCFMRKHAFEVMDAELRRARRSQMPLSLVMFDIDHFKSINDRYGHLAGDAVLAAVGARMKAVLRGSDLKCRYGGEEFLILLPDTPLSGAQRVAETLRREFAEHPVAWNEVSITATASFGVTAITPGELDPLVIMARADAALYRAKEGGRNCIRIGDEQKEAVT